MLIVLSPRLGSASLAFILSVWSIIIANVPVVKADLENSRRVSFIRPLYDNSHT